MALAEYPKPNFPDFMAAEIALWMENIPPEDVTPVVVDVEGGDYSFCDKGGISLKNALWGKVRTFMTDDVTPHPYKIGILIIGGSSQPGFIVPLHPGSETHHVVTKKRKAIMSHRQLVILMPPLTVNIGLNNRCKSKNK